MRHLEVPQGVAKDILKGFLRRWFEYNPDAHVRSAYDEAVIQKVTVTDEQGNPVDNIDTARPLLSELRVRLPKPSAKKLGTQVCEYLEYVMGDPARYNAARTYFRDERLAEICQAMQHYRPIFEKYLCPVLPKSAARSAVDVVPPQDTFHRWAYYTEVNYEELRAATESIYHEKPDLDFALILYDTWEGTEAEIEKQFEEFKTRYQDEIISSIKALEHGSWTLLGDFKKNRENITFYNKHTDIIKRIMDRHAEDRKLGQDLMRKRVYARKAQNIREEGPDAPGLKDYKQTVGSLTSKGAEKVISPEDMKRLERARGDVKAAHELALFEQQEKELNTLLDAKKHRPLLSEETARIDELSKALEQSREMLAVPDNAIQVDVFAHDPVTGTLSKSKFYTQAEDPEQISETPVLAPHAQQYLVAEQSVQQSVQQPIAQPIAQQSAEDPPEG